MTERKRVTLAERKAVLKKLFFSTLYLSAFTFGGGYVIVTLLKRKFVDEYHWIEEDEMLDLVAIAQSAPGCNCGQWGHCGGLQAGRTGRRCHCHHCHDHSALCDHLADFGLLHSVPG